MSLQDDYSRARDLPTIYLKAKRMLRVQQDASESEESDADGIEKAAYLFLQRAPVIAIEEQLIVNRMTELMNISDQSAKMFDNH